MTQFSAIPISDIRISHDRMREDLGDIEALAQSIKTFGQLQPIIVADDNELVDGFRRYTAHKHLGATHILAVHKRDIDELMLRELELETNIQRKDMTWQERVKAIAEIARIRKVRNPDVSQAQIAAVANTTQHTVSQAIQIDAMMQLFPEIKEAKSFSQAKSWAQHKASTINRVIEVQASPEKFASIEERIVLGDSVEIIKSLPDGIFAAVITDPPFGIDYDGRKANKQGVETAYDDTPEAYERLLTMAPDIYRVIKPNGWFVWFLGISWYQRCVDVFTAAGFTVDPLPIIWNRSGGKCHTNRPDKYMARAYDIALHCHKGSPEMILRGKPNVITVDPVSVHDRDLMVERPVELYAEIIRRLTVPGELVADFFVGSGSCPAAAASTGRQYWGCEQNPERRVVAIKKIYANTPT